MLEMSELSVLLSGMKQDDLEVLFASIDVDGNGAVSFNEFIDFVFKPIDKIDCDSLQARLQDSDSSDSDLGELKGLRNLAIATKPVRKEKVESITFAGSLLYKGVSGVLEGAPVNYNGHQSFEWSRARRVRNIEPLEYSGKKEKDAALTPDVPESGMFTLAKAGANLQTFYGWNADYSLVGWFISEEKPLPGQPVTEYLLFNPSPIAASPDDCRAMWQTQDGERDKRMFCEDKKLESRRSNVAGCISEEGLLDDELWGDISSDDEADWREGGFEQEWEEQPGEAEEEGDDAGWDSDGFLEKNEYRKQIGADARTAKLATDASEAERLAREAREAEDAERLRLEAEAEALKNGGESESRPVPKAPKKGKKKPFGIDALTLAPGFEVKTAKKAIPEDHLAHRHRGKKTTNAHHVDGELGVPRPRSRKSMRGSTVSVAEVICDDEWGDYSIYEDGSFIDPSFPPCTRSLGVQMSEVDGWTRLSDIVANPCLFKRIVPDGCLSQGFPGNIWFMSACAAAAEYPAWIQSMFGHKGKLSKAGRYKVRLFHPGLKRFVRIEIDDYIPTKKGPYGLPHPAFAGVTGDGEIWAALVEKAFAKLCGSYAATEWGLHAFGLHYICGGKCTGSWARLGPSRWKRSVTMWNGDEDDTFDRAQYEGKQEIGDWRDEDEVWCMIRLAMERCYPAACAIDREKKELTGLLSDRLYSIIGAREIPTDDGWTLRLVLMRNPYDVGKWEGRWSDYSEAWDQNPGVRDAVDHKPHKDGTFWMSYTDFDQNFELVDFVRKAMPVQGCNKYKMVGIRRGLMKAEQSEPVSP